jgi:hypothetical protein
VALVSGLAPSVPKYDTLMHFVGGAAMAFFLHRAFLSGSQLGLLAPHHRTTHRLLVFTGTCTMAVFWEFAEFFFDWRFGARLQSGVGDTMADLFFGLAGTLLVVILT